MGGTKRRKPNLKERQFKLNQCSRTCCSVFEGVNTKTKPLQLKLSAISKPTTFIFHHDLLSRVELTQQEHGRNEEKKQKQI